MAIYFYFGLSIRTFEVTIITAVKFLICLVSEILKDKKGQRQFSHSPSWILKYIHHWIKNYFLSEAISKFKYF